MRFPERFWLWDGLFCSGISFFLELKQTGCKRDRCELIEHLEKLAPVAVRAGHLLAVNLTRVRSTEPARRQAARKL
jgi:hypothetical protein